MRIQHNIMAMSAYRNYTNNVSAMKKNLEKLSSGYKINRAGDDAAGLAISEKMRAQITGLETAQKNAKDGISLVQTAEGALTEVHDMLNRMVELATMSANGTYDDDTDRAQLQKEVDQLRSEIDRIADSANFNGIKLLNGNLSETPATSASVETGDLTSVTVTAVADGNLSDKTTTKGKYTIDLKNFNASITNTAASGSITITVGSVAIAQADVATTGGSVSASNFSAVSSSVSIGGVTFNITVSGDKITLEMANDPTTSTQCNIGMAVDVQGAVDSTPGGNPGNQAHPLSVEIEQQAIYAEPRVYAQGSFDLNTVFGTSLTDGSVLKIGDSTYVFAVGPDSKFKGGAGVIDLTDMTEGSVDLAEAARRLTVTAEGNAQFKVTNNNNGTVINLTEKEGGFKDYSVYNLAGSSATTKTDGVWADKDGNSLVQIGQATAKAGTAATGGLTLQIGDTAEPFNQLKVSIGDTHCTSLGIDEANLSIANQTDAAAAVDKIKAAINQISDIRGTLGATQNRLDHTINNLSVMTENIQDAESTIRDTDVADEMMAYTKNNILIQSAQAMLAQANQVPQGVLQLLQ